MARTCKVARNGWMTQCVVIHCRYIFFNLYRVIWVYSSASDTRHNVLILLGQLNGDNCMVDMHAVSEHGYFDFHLWKFWKKHRSEFGSASLMVEQNGRWIALYRYSIYTLYKAYKYATYCISIWTIRYISTPIHRPVCRESQMSPAGQVEYTGI